MPESVVLEKFLEDANVSVFFGGRRVVDVEELSTEEEEAIKTCLEINLRLLRRVAPTIAETVEEQTDLVYKFAQIAKALFPESKPIKFPSEIGTLGINFLIPQAIKYAATPSSDKPCYTSYKSNSWEIDLTAGTPAYFFGDGTNYYRASPERNKHALLLIFKDGVIEVGSTPSIDQFHIKTEVEQKYGVYTVHPLVEIPIEGNKAIYQYPTLGAIPVYHDFGIMWGFMPRRSGTATIKLLGVVIYEHEFLSSLRWVT